MTTVDTLYINMSQPISLSPDDLQFDVIVNNKANNKVSRLSSMYLPMNDNFCMLVTFFYLSPPHRTWKWTWHDFEHGRNPISRFKESSQEAPYAQSDEPQRSVETVQDRSETLTPPLCLPPSHPTRRPLLRSVTGVAVPTIKRTIYWRKAFVFSSCIVFFKGFVFFKHHSLTQLAACTESARISCPGS